MAYQVLARKYRPQKFSDVVGQDHVTQTLANAIQQNRIAHAYLFVGPRGTGKTTLARIFAKCLNCSNGPKVNFEDEDPRCREIVEGRSLDVLEIDGASNRGIEEIRALRETVKYAPAASKYKIYIIDEVHMLTKEAFNALLKTLEEPPPHVKFMFATTEPDKVLPTILSRCQRFDLRQIPASLIVKHLAQIAALEQVKIDEDALMAIARGAEGSMRDAESALDQLISFCGATIVEADVLSMFGLASQRQILLLAEAIVNGKPDLALRQLHDLARNGKDMARLLSDLLGHFRNLLVFQVSKGDLALLETSEAEAANLSETAERISSAGVTRILEVLADCEARLRDAASKKIVIEVALLKAIQMRHALSLDAVLEKLHQLRLQEAPDNRSSSPALPPGPAKAEATRDAAPIPPLENEPADKPDLSSKTRWGLSELWDQVIASVSKASPFVRSYLLEAHPVSFEKNVLTIGFDPEFADHLSLVDTAKTRALIAAKVQDCTRLETQVRFISAERPPGAQKVPSAPSSPRVKDSDLSGSFSTPPIGPKGATTPIAFKTEELSTDPLIKQALELFKGQIVEVRA